MTQNMRHKILLDIELKTDPSITTSKSNLVLINNNKEISADHRVKMKESEKIDKYQYLARELKKLWDMRVTMTPIVIGTLGIVPKDPEKSLWELEIRGRIEITQTTAVLKSAKILKKVL